MMDKGTKSISMKEMLFVISKVDVSKQQIDTRNSVNGL